MERWESTKDQWRGSEVGGIHVDAQELINASQAGGRARYRVVGGREAIQILVPRRRAGENQLDANTCDVEIPKGARIDGDGARSREDKHDGGPDHRPAKVQEAVRDPRQDV